MLVLRTWRSRAGTDLRQVCSRTRTIAPTRAVELEQFASALDAHIAAAWSIGTSSLRTILLTMRDGLEHG